MATVNMIRCEHCKAIMNPNWTACLVCGAESERDPEAILADAYRQYWTLSATKEPMATFVSLHREIDLIEQQVGADAAWRTLEEAARTWYQEKGTCPFCGKTELHLSGRP